MAERGALAVLVEGRATVQGSKKLGEHGQMMENAGAWLARWRRDVIEATRYRFIDLGLSNAAQMPYFPADVPLQVAIEFYLDLRAYKATSITDPPDLDKLTRAVLDALTIARAWGDDGQVVKLFVRKNVVPVDERPGAFILVEHDHGEQTRVERARLRVARIAKRWETAR